MALKIGRQGYIGLGVETTPGTPVASVTVLPFISNTIRPKHEAINDIAARGSRVKNFTSVLGKQWGEGELDVNVDSLNFGYLLKLTTGTEAVNTVATGVYDHLFYTTVSGNTPATATLYQYQGVDTQIFSSMAVDKLDIEVKDALMTAKATFKGFAPSSTTLANTSTSGTLYAFNDYQIQLGNTLVLAAAASASPITDFNLSISNNAEVIFESATARATRVFWKELTVTGAFTRYFETATDRDNYLNLTKQSLIMTASGVALPSSNIEKLVINLARLQYTDTEISGGIDDFFAVKTTFTAEVDPAQGKQYDIILRNYKSSAYA